MLRVLVFVIVASVVAVAATWLADFPAEVAILGQGYEVRSSLGVLVLGVLLFAAILVVLFELYRWFVTAPRRLRRYRQEVRTLRGYRALGNGLLAAASGDAARARALGMAIAAFDLLLPEDHPAWSGIERHATLEGLLAACDVVSLHVPLTSETRGLLDARRIAAMRPGAILVNTARGPVVEAGALAAALRAGRLGGAALDVFEEEPLSAEAARIFVDCPNLILTPHIAGITVESNARVSAMVAEAVRRVLEGL
ncbi:MAG: hypothetical protein K6T74_15065 [Geminicoccaceae bacterium]|nr:hypothetical protein [Geminicoccaceae bacterium]